jgi:hypothetical protein
MLTARRLYLYIVSGIALGIFLAGLVNLLSLVLDQLGMGLGDELLAGGGIDREALSVSLALIAVGLPLWGLHWWLTERLVHRPDEAGGVERRSVARAVYFLVVPALTLLLAATSASDLVREGLRTLAGTRVTDDGLSIFGLLLGTGMGMAGSLATATVTGAAWAYHVWIRGNDARTGPLDGAAAWISRLYLYGAALVGGVALLFALSTFIETGLRMVAGRQPVGEPSDWWTLALTAAAAQALVGGLVWAGHWGYSLSMFRAPDWRSDAERTSRTRGGYLMTVVLVSTVVVALAFSGSVAALLAWALDVGAATNTTRLAQDMVGPPLAMIPFMAAWWWHRRRAVSEALETDGPDGALAARRVADYVVAAVGITFVGVGSARVVGITADVLFGVPPLGEPARWWREEMSQFASYAIVGLPIWLSPWYVCQRRRGTDQEAEAGSAPRRIYLYLVLGVTMIASGVSLAWLLYRGIRLIVGLDAGIVPADVDGPLGVLLVTGVLLLYHLFVLRGDLALRTQPAAVTPPSEEVSAITEASEELVIVGPPGADFDAVNAALRERLPAGFTMRVERQAGAGVKS